MASLFASMPGAVAYGIIWGIMAIGVYITFRVLDVADLTVDGSMATGNLSRCHSIINCFIFTLQC